jgi:hypothetical protein
MSKSGLCRTRFYHTGQGQGKFPIWSGDVDRDSELLMSSLTVGNGVRMELNQSQDTVRSQEFAMGPSNENKTRNFTAVVL